MTQQDIDELTYHIIGCAIEVHKNLGPGLLESVYEKCMLQELKIQDLRATNQIVIPVEYKGVSVDCNLRLDILVEDLILVELKAAEKLHPIFEAQLITYMKLLQKPKGILLNFNVTNIFKEGQKTFVNGHYSKFPIK